MVLFFQCDVIIEMCKFETWYFSQQKYLSSNFHLIIYIFKFLSEMSLYIDPDKEIVFA